MLAGTNGKNIMFVPNAQDCEGGRMSAKDYEVKMQNLNSDVDNIETEFTSQDKIAYLRRYKAVDKRIDQEVEELAKWNCRATKVTPTYSDMPKGGETSDKIQSAVESMMEIEEQINVDIDELVKIKSEIMGAIKTVNGETLQNILYMRYICGKKWEQIAIDMNYSYMQVCRLHGKALNQMML